MSEAQRPADETPLMAPTMAGTSPVPSTASISGISALSSSRYRSAKQPVTMSRLHAPSFLCPAISRIVSIDSCLAESMNAQVFTTSTSAAAASCVSSWPASRASPSITSESTRFLGQPREIRPIFINCVGNRVPGSGNRTWDQILESFPDPGSRSPDPVRDTTGKACADTESSRARARACRSRRRRARCPCRSRRAAPCRSVADRDTTRTLPAAGRAP